MEIVPTGENALRRHAGILVDHLPQLPWQFRVVCSGQETFLELCCIWELCRKVVRCRAVDSKGENTLGAVACPYCGKKIYVRINKEWFECS